MRLLVRCVVKCQKWSNKHNRVFKNNVVRCFNNQPGTVLHDQTLTGRLLYYLNGNQAKLLDSSSVAADILQSLVEKQASNLHKYNNQEIVSACNLLANNKNGQFPNVLNELALECCIRLNELEPKDIYQILNIYMKLSPEKICSSKFYQLAIEHLCEKVDKLSKDDLVQFMFYIGLKKKSPDSRSKIKSCMKHLTKQYIKDLTTEDLCIVCNATFKTSTKIFNRSFLEKVRNYLKDNLHILKDPALFVTFIKTIRHNRDQDDDLLSTISCTIFFNKTLEYYSFPAMCHVLALYADHLYYDDVLFNAFVTKCIEELKKFDFTRRDNSEYPRLKDIKRLLWALSNANYTISRGDIKDVIIPQIVSRIYLGEARSDHESLIEIMLYLWMMNYHAYELAPHALTSDHIEEVKNNKSLGVKRLNLLLSCIYFEDRNFFKSLGLRAQKIPYNDQNIQLRKRPALDRVLKHLKYLTSKTDINKFEIGYQVPYLNIVGITGYKDNIYKTVNVEIMDHFTCMKNRDAYPTGLMQLKLRILENMDEALLVVSSSEIEELTEAELSDYLLDEINLVC